jgi:hypothetical protein
MQAPFGCDKCHREFSQKASLLRHLAKPTSCVLTDDRFKCAQCPAHFSTKGNRDAHQRRCNLGALPAPTSIDNSTSNIDNSTTNSLTTNVSGAGAIANIDNSTNITLNLSVNVFGKEDASFITEKTTEELRELLGGSFRGAASNLLLAYQIALRCDEAHPENHSIILNDPAMKKSQVHLDTGWKETDLSTALWSIMSSDAMTLSKDLDPELTAAPYESIGSGRPESGELARRLLDLAHGANTRSLSLAENKRLLAEALYATSKLYCDNSPQAAATAKRESKAKAAVAGISQGQYEELLKKLAVLERHAEEANRRADESSLQLQSIQKMLELRAAPVAP